MTAWYTCAPGTRLYSKWLLLALSKISLHSNKLFVLVGNRLAHSPVLTTIVIMLHNLFEHNTDYLISCPTGVMLLHALSATQTRLEELSTLRREVWLARDWIQFHGALRAQCAHYILWRHHMALGHSKNSLPRATCRVSLASSPGPTQKSGKGPGVTCKYSRMCRVSILRNSS